MLHIRPALPEDTPGVLALVAEIYREYECVLDAENEEPHLLAPGPNFRRDGGEFWVVEEDDVVKATVAVSLHGEDAELKTLYVHSSLRRQGWGVRLVSLATEYARGAGRSSMLLWTDTRFLDAHRLYRRMGFSECGERELHDSNNSREYCFTKSLVL
ncbi:MAG TPA: GNAT family N-acetyltransferase [Pyrinomonadaceae bacterium]|jgi:N-acetylglutamate synthase-like GNAT family acetyltransferase|nr:GNAT family N-acetyltransferase [Pyrinomonadaceae bacterium]